MFASASTRTAARRENLSCGPSVRQLPVCPKHTKYPWVNISHKRSLANAQRSRKCWVRRRRSHHNGVMASDTRRVHFVGTVMQMASNGQAVTIPPDRSDGPHRTDRGASGITGPQPLLVVHGRDGANRLRDVETLHDNAFAWIADSRNPQSRTFRRYSVEAGEQPLGAASERRGRTVGSVEWRAGHGTVANHDERSRGMLWIGAPGRITEDSGEQLGECGDVPGTVFQHHLMHRVLGVGIFGGRTALGRYANVAISSAAAAGLVFATLSGVPGALRVWASGRPRSDSSSSSSRCDGARSGASGR